MLILKLSVRTMPCFLGEKAETQFQSEWMYASFVDHIISSALKELQDDETNKSNITITGAFPTEQAIRHKVQKKKFKEQYFDGCGSDTALIGYSRMRSSVPLLVPLCEYETRRAWLLLLRLGHRAVFRFGSRGRFRILFLVRPSFH